MNGETKNPSAYYHYLQGRQLFKEFTRRSNEAAKAAFAEAVRLDPEFARAYGWLGYAHLQDVQDGWTDDPKGSADFALEQAIKGIGAAPDDYYTHWNLASIHAGRSETEDALKEYKEALERNPSDADLLADMADLLSYQGRAKAGEAVEKIKQAMELKIPQWYHWSLGFAYFQQRDYQNAAQALERMSDPPNTAYLLLLASQKKAGKPIPSLPEIMARLLEKDPSWVPEYLNRFPFADPKDEQHYLDCLQDIGIKVPPPER